jgi:hypothetical protein
MTILDIIIQWLFNIIFGAMPTDLDKEAAEEIVTSCLEGFDDWVNQLKYKPFDSWEKEMRIMQEQIHQRLKNVFSFYEQQIEENEQRIEKLQNLLVNVRYVIWFTEWVIFNEDFDMEKLALLNLIQESYSEKDIFKILEAVYKLIKIWIWRMFWNTTNPYFPNFVEKYAFILFGGESSGPNKDWFWDSYEKNSWSWGDWFSY